MFTLVAGEKVENIYQFIFFPTANTQQSISIAKERSGDARRTGYGEKSCQSRVRVKTFFRSVGDNQQLPLREDVNGDAWSISGADDN